MNDRQLRIAARLFCEGQGLDFNERALNDDSQWFTREQLVMDEIKRHFLIAQAIKAAIAKDEADQFDEWNTK